MATPHQKIKEIDVFNSFHDRLKFTVRWRIQLEVTN